MPDRSGENRRRCARATYARCMGRGETSVIVRRRPSIVRRDEQFRHWHEEMTFDLRLQTTYRPPCGTICELRRWAVEPSTKLCCYHGSSFLSWIPYELNGALLRLLAEGRRLRLVVISESAGELLAVRLEEWR